MVVPMSCLNLLSSADFITDQMVVLMARHWGCVASQLPMTMPRMPRMPRMPWSYICCPRSNGMWVRTTESLTWRLHVSRADELQ